MVIQFNVIRNTILLYASILLSGCAGDNLTSEVNEVKLPFRIQNDASGIPILDVAAEKNAVTLAHATAYAYNMSEAFRKAGNQSASMQNGLTFLVAGAAAATVIGAIDEIAQERLARTAVAGTALFAMQNAGLSQSDVDALYVGAQQANCIALASAVHQSSVTKVPSDALVTVFYVREVELRARLSLVNDAVSFDQFVSLFRNAIQTSFRIGTSSSSNPYILILDECLEIDAPDRSEPKALRTGTENGATSAGNGSVAEPTPELDPELQIPEGAAQAAAVVSEQ